MFPNLQQNSQVFSLKIVIYKISFLTMHQADDTILPSQFCHRGIQDHRLPRNDFGWKYIFQIKQNLCTRNTLKFERLNPYLEIRNGLQSVSSPFIHVTKSAKRTIFQSIISLFDFCILRPTRWDRLWSQVQIMTNQIIRFSV